MPIGLGLASSHAPAIDYRTDQYEPMYQRITVARGIPQPPGAALETPEVIDSYIQRVQSAFNVLEEQLKAYNPELLIMIGGDQTEMFDESNVPNLMMFLGDAAWGHNTLRGNEPSEEDIVHFKVDVPTSKRLLNRLVEEAGFDIAFSEEQVALGTPAKGLPHAWIRPAPYSAHRLERASAHPLHEHIPAAVADCAALFRPWPGNRARVHERPAAHRHLRIGRFVTRSRWTSVRLGRRAVGPLVPRQTSDR